MEEESKKQHRIKKENLRREFTCMGKSQWFCILLMFIKETTLQDYCFPLEMKYTVFKPTIRENSNLICILLLVSLAPLIYMEKKY